RMMVMQDALNAPAEKHKAPAIFTSARDDLKEALRLDPQLHAARHNLARVITRRKELDKTWEVPLEDLEELRPNQVGPLSAMFALQIARVYAACKRPEFREELFHYLRVAIDLGLNPKVLVREHLFADLRSD